jgi:hypothetical protein
MLKGNAQVAYFSPLAVFLFEGGVLLPAFNSRSLNSLESTPGTPRERAYLRTKEPESTLGTSGRVGR